MMRESARAIARRLFGGESVGTWSMTDARNSSGLRVTLTPESGVGAGVSLFARRAVRPSSPRSGRP